MFRFGGLRTAASMPSRNHYLLLGDNSAIEHIKRTGSIKMGACRDNPSKGSLGEILQSAGKSPQYLSYVLPLLGEKGKKLISHYKEGRSYWVKYLQ